LLFAAVTVLPPAPCAPEFRTAPTSIQRPTGIIAADHHGSSIPPSLCMTCRVAHSCALAFDTVLLSAICRYQCRAAAAVPSPARSPVPRPSQQFLA
jgi:hypothetical protein